MNPIPAFEIRCAAENIARRILVDMRYTNRHEENEILVWGVPNGGIFAAYEVVEALSRKNAEARITYYAPEATVIIDDLVDSGTTAERMERTAPGKPFYFLFSKNPQYQTGDSRFQLHPQAWYSFPWERAKEGGDGTDDIFTRLLQAVGEDPSRGGLVETPRRAMAAWRDWTSGYAMDPTVILKTFKDGAEKYDQMVTVRDIPVYSHCEHHLAAIFGVAHVAYIPNGSIVGLSKLNRLVGVFARRLQVQERLTNQIADALDEGLSPTGVAVSLECRHLCMESRGVNQQGHTTITTALRGVFREDPAAKQEFFSNIGR